MVRKFLEGVNMFPYSNFIRIGGKQKLDHACGGIVSLFIFLVMGSVLVAMLMEAFRKETIFYTSQNLVSTQPPLTTVSTSHNSEVYEPFMVALQVDKPYGCSTASVSIQARHLSGYGSMANPNRQINYTDLQLQPCTSEKFKQFQLNVRCENTCQPYDCGYVNVYLISSEANPDNATHPFSYSIKMDALQVSQKHFYMYAYQMDQTVLVTDNSLLPVQDITVRKGLSSLDLTINSFVQSEPEAASSLFIVRRSSNTKVIKRSFLKFIDVFSYVGGIFPALFAICFFVQYFSKFVFELNFAWYIFRSIEVKYNGVLSYFKYTVYRLLSMVNCAPENWRIPKRQQEIQQNVTKLLDFSYLLKRIEFLQKAITILLEKHQLKGLHLLHSLTLDEAEEDYRHHKYRDRFICYLYKLVEQKAETAQELQKIDKEKMKRLTGSSWAMRKKKIEQGEDDCLGSASNLKKRQMGQEVQPPKILKRTSKPAHLMHRMFSEVLGSSQISKLRQESLVIHLEQEMAKIKPLKAQDVNESQLQQELQKDLLLLFREAQNPNGDLRSQRIYGCIDPWLRRELGTLMSQYESDRLKQERSPRFRKCQSRQFEI